MKTLSVLGVAVLAPLAALFFILTIAWKTVEALTEYLFKSERGIENETVSQSSIED
ncbi:MAG: hypothetical protein ACJA08_001034 [Cyclobacteriaceae bacterium]|jgi:hypothetical protein